MGAEIIEEKNVEIMSYEDITKELNDIKNQADSQPDVSGDQESAPADEPAVPEAPVAKEPEAKAPEQDDFNFDDTEYKGKGWTDEQIAVLKKKEEQIYHKQKFISRQEAEVASARKKESELAQKEFEIRTQLAQLEAQKTTLKDDFYTNPEAYDEAIAKEHMVKQQQQQVAVERQILDTKKLIYGRVPEFEGLLTTTVPEVIREDATKAGMAPSEVDALIVQFKQNWATADPRDILLIAEKAKVRTELNEARAKLKEMSNSPDTVGKKIAAVANQRPIANGAGSPPAVLRDPYEMTSEDIDKELEEITRRR